METGLHDTLKIEQKNGYGGTSRPPSQDVERQE